MKTNNLYITLFAALAITACGKDNELPQGSAKDPNADMPDAYILYRYQYSPHHYDRSQLRPCH